MKGGQKKWGGLRMPRWSVHITVWGAEPEHTNSWDVAVVFCRERKARALSSHHTR
jgi:hypothetical protein